ncbi:NADPH:adrenodoxin oxidoreductase, mitochondrial [Patella vulgata]|uniref:NADPH:adrenodoxin oxidoreductase, mitochondrial n=1 Tax=Patella vulgata TaxID=6465 RepID=UPI00217F9EC2|nr:NADPH:adrenodoxin oxidoreductase, mitochondrial [Patella vulgata]
MASYNSRQFLLRLSRQIHKCQRRLYTNNNAVPHVAIIGSGPAGFYTAQQLLKGHSTIKVDIYEKLPVPFGLVRFGVAPDHPEVKNVINTFTQTAENERCSFMGNITIGKDITVADLQKAYTAVVLSYGADADRTLGIPGEDLPNVISARTLVGWYNGLPHDKNLNVDLSGETAVILGHGNVALDVTRILLTPVSILAKTDISQHSLDALSKSNIKKVYVVGRRGPLQVAFTIKELREMIHLPECKTIIHKDDVAHLQPLIEKLPRPRRRLTDLLYKTGCTPSEKDLKLWANAKRQWELQFLKSPTKIVPTEDKKIKSVLFTKNTLQGDDIVNQKVISTEHTEEIECGLVLRSIGYKSVSIDNTIPFDAKRGVIPNENGRVTGVSGLYCSGWVGLGPVGVILSTMTDGFNTGKLILKDIESGHIRHIPKSGKEEILPVLNEKGVKVVNFMDWKQIDKAETQKGETVGKPREKIISIEEMIQATKT